MCYNRFQSKEEEMKEEEMSDKQMIKDLRKKTGAGVLL